MMDVAVVQNRVFQKREDTFTHIRSLLGKVPDSTDLIVFPEMFSTPYEYDCFERDAETKDGESCHFLKEIAIAYHALVIGGSMPERVGNAVFNTTFVYDKTGTMITKYRKQHLFAVEYPDGSTFDESRVLSAGQGDCLFDTDHGRIGVMICFDVRFPVLASRLAKSGAQYFAVPAAFNTYTGPMHWHVTMRARAIDNQTFLFAASPARNSHGSYEPYGHSLIVDPFGIILAEASESPDVITATIDPGQVSRARKTIPIMKTHR